MTLKDHDLIEEALALPNSDWDKVNALIDLSETEEARESLNRIMITKFHNEEHENDSL